MGQTASAPSAPPTCPVKHDAPAKCPIDHSAAAPAPAVEPAPAQCPIDHRNQMPTLSQHPAPNQSAHLSTERVVSEIPRDASASWEYPSPQQFYNALVRKGWETPEEHIESMVDIHNFLNDQAWAQVLQWERNRDPEQAQNLQLARFQGKPGQLSPKARFFLLAGRLFPSRFNTEPPFDRHDWIVRRPKTGEQVRYVIDYYSAPPEPDGSPVFSLDVRPALDSFDSVKQRIMAATSDAWDAARTRDNESSR
ncbi:cytochrome c and c1 heme-lyase [Exidia glandulosa HHB12029]|uniref:Holocytochrome c-type synthase n=1 Tax=Exidia glandulosa HHB12029 TaxID=1314781 RepID=A0A165JBB7_EXIGL|nr:cytochrome c and c1 heme-lyase [Exidia glandulosa HHB12029]